MMRRTSWWPAAAAAAAAAVLGAAPAAAQQTRAAAEGRGGGAATVDRLATNAAVRELRRGGNAVDAAVAAAGVLGVTEPFSAGIGGGGFMVVRRPGGRVETIDGRETAPRAMEPDAFQEGGTPLPFNDARYSGRSAGVPGTVATWDRALRRYGTIGLRRALRPGIRVARRGFRIDQTFFSQVEGNVAYFDDVPSTARLYLDRDGTPRDVGERQRNRAMARAYAHIARRGADRGFYRGPIAAAMVKAAQDPPVAPGADHTWRPGLMTLRDLRGYDALRREPTHSTYRGLDVWGMGPPSSGGSTVGEILNVLDGYAPLGADRGQALHRYLEASRLAYADRNAFLADPRYFDVPLHGLLSVSFAAERRGLIGETAATSPVAPGNPYDDNRAVVEARSAAGDRGTSTTHLTVADRRGLVVSYTFTIESTGGNGIVVPGWGFLLNNELTDFNYDSTTHPNRVEGGKRPRSSMAPTIVTDPQGEPVLAVGSPGGATIITTVAQILVERFDLGQTLPAAIAAPRVSQRNAATTSAEPAFIASADAAPLTARGQTLANGGEIGAATGIEFLGGGRMVAAAEPVRRGGGSAGVVRPR